MCKILLHNNPSTLTVMHQSTFHWHYKILQSQYCTKKEIFFLAQSFGGPRAWHWLLIGLWKHFVESQDGRRHHSCWPCKKRPCSKMESPKKDSEAYSSPLMGTEPLNLSPFCQQCFWWPQQFPLGLSLYYLFIPPLWRPNFQHMKLWKIYSNHVQVVLTIPMLSHLEEASLDFRFKAKENSLIKNVKIKDIMRKKQSMQRKNWDMLWCVHISLQ